MRGEGEGREHLTDMFSAGGGERREVRVFFCGRVGKAVPPLTFSKSRQSCVGATPVLLSVGVVKANRRKRHFKGKVPKNRSEMQTAAAFFFFFGQTRWAHLCGVDLLKSQEGNMLDHCRWCRIGNGRRGYKVDHWRRCQISISWCGVHMSNHGRRCFVGVIRCWIHVSTHRRGRCTGDGLLRCHVFEVTLLL